MRIWDPATGVTRHTLAGHTRGVSALVVAPDGSWLASADIGGAVRIWDPTTGVTRHILTGHTRWVEALVVAPDGSWLASAGYGGEVRVWDPATGAVRHALTGHTGGVRALVVAPDGSWLASASDDRQLRISDPVTGAPLTSLRVAGRLSHLVVTPVELQPAENAVPISWHSAVKPTQTDSMTWADMATHSPPQTRMACRVPKVRHMS